MLKLRKIEPEDLPFLYYWENDAAAWSDGSNHNPLSKQDLRGYLASTTGDIYRDGQLRLLIEDEVNQGGVMTVGCIDLFDLDARNRRVAVGVYVASEFRGRGYALKALKEIEAYAFDFLRLRLLYAFVSDTNAASSALFSAAGYMPSTSVPAWTLEGGARLWYKVCNEIKN